MSRETRTARLLEALARVPEVLAAFEPSEVEVCKGIHASVVEHDLAVPTYHLRASGRQRGGPHLWSSAPAPTIVEVFMHNRDERFAHEVARACVVGRAAAVAGKAIYAEAARREAIVAARRASAPRATAPAPKSRRRFTDEERAAYSSLAWLVRQRFGGACVYCGRPGARTVDHLHPRVLGGRDERDNLVAACLWCNRLKGTMSVDAFLDLVESERPGASLEILGRVAEVLERTPSSGA